MSRAAVVTGGASGVGHAVCRMLAAAGTAVAVLDRDGDGARAVAEELGRAGAPALGLAADVSDRRALASAYGHVRAELGPIEILVANAAIAGFVPFEQLTPEAFERTLAINLTGTFHTFQLAIPDMVDAGWGRIVTISSAAGQAGSRLQADYSASKGGVIALTKAVALEYADSGITANTVPPFMVDTPLFRKAQADGFLPEDRRLTRMVPAGRLGTGDDVAAVVAFLCSDAAAYVTGQVIGVNGGAVT